MKLPPDEFITPEKALLKYPALSNLHWNASKIGTFYSCGLVIGYKTRKATYIRIDTLLELAQYTNKVLQKDHFNIDNKQEKYYSPEELILKYPKVAKHLHWTCIKVGIFLSARLVSGHRVGAEHKAYINENSYLELIKYVKALNRKRENDY